MPSAMDELDELSVERREDNIVFMEGKVVGPKTFVRKSR